MKATGMTRPVDELGRVVIPKEIRRQLDIKDSKDSFEIFTDGDSLILKKYNPGCIFCGEVSDTRTYKGHTVCTVCASRVGAIV